MEVHFKNKALEDIYETGKEVGKPRYGKNVVRGFIARIQTLRSISNSSEMVQFKSWYFEKLEKEAKYRGMHSIRVNKQFRIILKIDKKKNKLEVVEVCEVHDLTDYH